MKTQPRKIIKIFSGETETESDCLKGLHPVAQARYAVKATNQLLYETDPSKFTVEFHSNQPDFVSTIYYHSRRHYVTCELYLNGKKVDIDTIFNDFNRAFEI